MDSSEVFAIVVQSIIGLLGTALLLYFMYHAIRMWRNRNKPGEHITVGPIYGAWQGHNLGTTTLDPSELAEIEKELDVPPKPRMEI